MNTELSTKALAAALFDSFHSDAYFSRDGSVGVNVADGLMAIAASLHRLADVIEARGKNGL